MISCEWFRKRKGWTYRKRKELTYRTIGGRSWMVASWENNWRKGPDELHMNAEKGS